jgi:hypothetical protein
MPSDPGEPPAASRVMRVAGLHYGVAWRSERVKWAPEAFPVEIALPGWSLEVTKPHIAARPQTKVYNEGSAREALEPRLDAWAAELSVVYDMPMQYWFLGSELVPDVAVPMSGRNDLVIGDLVSAVDELKVVITRSELHGPTWTKPPSELAREAREYCLLPLRSQRRPEADAAYWLYEQVKRWAGSESEAARRLQQRRPPANEELVGPGLRSEGGDGEPTFDFGGASTAAANGRAGCSSVASIRGRRAD